MARVVEEIIWKTFAYVAGSTKMEFKVSSRVGGRGMD